VKDALALDDGEQVERIKRIRLLEGDVFGYEERYIPIEFSSKITQQALKSKAIYSLIENSPGKLRRSFL